MLTYRRIENEPRHAQTVWTVEDLQPRWFRDANAVWHGTQSEFLRWWRSLSDITGLFDGDRLLAVVYCEYPRRNEINVHFSILARVAEADLLRFFESLKRERVAAGVEIIQAWLLVQNRPMQLVAEKIGFRPTGGRMRHGSSRGRVLRWVHWRML